MGPIVRPLEFWFDFASPYCYIASEWVEATAARHGRTVRWRPFLLEAVYRVAELRAPTDHPLKREYSWRDFERSARFAGVPYVAPPKLPPATRQVARVFWWLAEADAAHAVRWAHAALRATFARGFDFGDAEALRELAASCALDPDAAALAAADPRWERRLQQESEAAIAQGVFGAPWIVVDGEPFWGNDRRVQVERWLESGPF